MNNHKHSIQARQRRCTHPDRRSMRFGSGSVRKRDLVRLVPRIVASGQEMYRKLTDPSPGRFAGMPGLASVSRILHRRNDEPNELSAIVSLLAAKAALGEPRSDVDSVQLWLGEWGAMLYGDVPPTPLPEQTYLTQEIVAEVGPAMARWLSNQTAIPALKYMREKCRAGASALHALVIGINHELAIRGAS